jgi:hypothetical protein
MINYPWINLLIVFAAILTLITRLFFMKNGFILEMKGSLPKILGRRKEDSKWARHLRIAIGAAVVFYVIDMFILFLQHEAEGLQQQIGGMS